MDTPLNLNKIILTASFIEMILVPSGVSKVIKNKSQKQDHITEFLIGHNSDSSEPLILVALEEVIFNCIPFIERVFINCFQVFSRNCGNCHGMIAKKYDLLLDKVYEQLELASWVGQHFTIHPAHQHFKQYYYQEWDERDRYIHDHIYAPYFSQDQAKNANGGVWPTDFFKIRFRPGGINYIYNIMTGYHFKAPYGMDVPKGKHFNPYFDHMIIGMPRQLHDGMLDYEDGTPASTPQMANDVANFIIFMNRRGGWANPDKEVRKWMWLSALILLIPLRYLTTYGFYRNLLSTRIEMYAVRDSLGYKHWKSGFKSVKAVDYRNAYWA